MIRHEMQPKGILAQRAKQQELQNKCIVLCVVVHIPVAPIAQ